MSWSGACAARLACSWRTMRGTGAAEAEGGGGIWERNLGFAVRAAQEFGLVDLLDTERFRLVEFRPWIGADDQRRGFLRQVVGNVSARRFNQIARVLAGECRQRAGDDVGLVGERPRAGGRGGLLQRQAERFESLDELAVARLGKEARDGVGNRRPDAAHFADLLGRRARQGADRSEMAR